LFCKPKINRRILICQSKWLEALSAPPAEVLVGVLARGAGLHALSALSLVRFINPPHLYVVVTPPAARPQWVFAAFHLPPVIL